MSFLKRLLGGGADETARAGPGEEAGALLEASEGTFELHGDEHRVTVWLRLVDPTFENEREQLRLFGLEDQLMRALESSGTGEHDTNALEARLSRDPARRTGRRRDRRDRSSRCSATLRRAAISRSGAGHPEAPRNGSTSLARHESTLAGHDAPSAICLAGGQASRACYRRAVNLRDVPGLPSVDVRPPVVAESGDPFAELRVTHLLARIPRGVPVRIRDVVDELNADHLDWSFSRGVVIAAAVQLQANWLTDYRNSSGIVLQEGIVGPEILVEDSSRVDPWIVRQVERLMARCTERLRAFAVEEGAIP